MSHRDIPPLHPATWFTAYSSDLCAVLGLLYTDSLYLLEREGVVGREGVRERGERERERERASERESVRTDGRGRKERREGMGSYRNKINKHNTELWCTENGCKNPMTQFSAKMAL